MFLPGLLSLDRLNRRTTIVSCIAYRVMTNIIHFLVNTPLHEMRDIRYQFSGARHDPRLRLGATAFCPNDNYSAVVHQMQLRHQLAKEIARVAIHRGTEMLDQFALCK